MLHHFLLRSNLLVPQSIVETLLCEQLVVVPLFGDTCVRPREGRVGQMEEEANKVEQDKALQGSTVSSAKLPCLPDVCPLISIKSALTSVL